ncbi:hypothetical protein GCM10022212_07840 [Actimicrobium antarcticum]|uniref:Uncharacterized protein n=1 Tax=Actimicrobium antarcticum TaxID=1051899 RepID=A0ABP7SRA2_9BURK
MLRIEPVNKSGVLPLAGCNPLSLPLYSSAALGKVRPGSYPFKTGSAPISGDLKST